MRTAVFAYYLIQAWTPDPSAGPPRSARPGTRTGRADACALARAPRAVTAAAGTGDHAGRDL